MARLTAEASSTVTEIDRYRVLCLMALGRASEADKVIESIVSNDPFYQPAAADAAPRVRAAFSSVRQRMLPGVARSLYIDAKAAFDRKAYPEAAGALEKTLKVIDNIEGAGRADLGDLRVLASGFLDSEPGLDSGSCGRDRRQARQQRSLPRPRCPRRQRRCRPPTWWCSNRTCRRCRSASSP